MSLSQVREWLCQFCRRKIEADPEIEKRTTAIGLFHYAHSYAQSASTISKAKVKATHDDSPIRFLYSHAVELYLKSFLRLNGISVAELRGQKFGHNTKKLVNKAIRLGLPVEDFQKQQIILLGDAIRDRYIETGGRTVLEIEALHALCEHLHKEIGPAIYQDAGIKRKLPPSA